MRLAHLSDLHLRGPGDLTWFERQLERVRAGAPDHLVISGDLLDRWRPALLAQALDCLERQALLTAARLTIIHGNHDLASSGGHPRSRRDLPRLILRAWDPPPLLAARRRRFYRAIERRATGVAAPSPFVKAVAGVTLATLDTVSMPWAPVRFVGGRIQVQQGLGCIRPAQAHWLEHTRPSLLVIHHYPRPVASFFWQRSKVEIAMEIRPEDRDRLWTAIRAAGVRLVLCGHVHRARLEWQDGVAVGLQGQSGAAWAQHTLSWYDIDDRGIRMEIERLR